MSDGRQLFAPILAGPNFDGLGEAMFVEISVRIAWAIILVWFFLWLVKENSPREFYTPKVLGALAVAMWCWRAMTAAIILGCAGPALIWLIVRRTNRRDDPQHTKRPPDPP
jgi:hypothetical protein